MLVEVLKEFVQLIVKTKALLAVEHIQEENLDSEAY